MDTTITAQVLNSAVQVVNTGDPVTLLTGAVASGKLIQVGLAKYVMPKLEKYPKVKAALPTLISAGAAAVAAWKGGVPVSSAIYGALIAAASAHLIHNSSLSTNAPKPIV